MRIAIIGGGIAGLAGAYELQQARAAGAQVDYTLFEATPRLGGSLSSEIVNGAVLERGPDSFLTEKKAAAELCRELGLASQLLPSNDSARNTFIVVRNRLVALPDGLMFMVPTRLIPTAFSPLFSLRTKIRMALELLRTPLLQPPRPSDGDESVAALVERHYGREAVDRLADPLLSGIYGGDSAQLSARAVLPRMVEMEQQYGSLTRGMLAARAKVSAQAKNSSKAPNREAAAIFTALSGGMQQLVDAITAQLDPASVLTSAPVTAIAITPSGWQVQALGETSGFDAILMASPAWAAAQMLSSVDSTLSEELAAIPYTSSITVNLVYDEVGLDKAGLGQLPPGFGFLVPAVEGRSMLACTFVHRKFLGRTPPGKAILRAFLGGAREKATLAESDATLIATVRRELSEILGAKVLSAAVEPEHTLVSRWPRAMPQYAVGHKERMERIAARVATLPGLCLAGNAYDGIGVSDCIRLGRQAAKDLLAPRVSKSDPKNEITGSSLAR